MACLPYSPTAKPRHATNTATVLEEAHARPAQGQGWHRQGAEGVVAGGRGGATGGLPQGQSTPWRLHGALLMLEALLLMLVLVLLRPH